jgi:hypothetical protein
MLFQNRVPKIGLDDPRSREQRPPFIHLDTITKSIPTYQRSWAIESLVLDKPKSISILHISKPLDQPVSVQDTNHDDSSNPNSVFRPYFDPPMRTIARPKFETKPKVASTGDEWWNNLR